VTFETALLSWHDFYVASAGAAAALLGLLFVGVSINLGALTAPERIDLRSRASLAFSNLIYVLVLSLTVLIPSDDARSLAIVCAFLAVFALSRVATRIVQIVRAWSRIANGVRTLRRLTWTLVAALLLGYAAIELWVNGTSSTLYSLISVVFLLLIGAADVSWDLLTTVSDEEAVRGGPPS
jgi:hypothetical protein